MGFSRGGSRGKIRGCFVKSSNRGATAKSSSLFEHPPPPPHMALRPRGFSAPPFLPHMRPPLGGLGPARGRPHVPGPMMGSGIPIPPPFRPPQPAPHSHAFPLPPTIRLHPPIPPPSPFLRPRGYAQGNAYSSPFPMRGKFAGKIGGGRGGSSRGRGKRTVYAEVTGGKYGNYYCETCDRSFRSQDALTEHLSQHQTCGLDGCQFTAHSAVVMRHVQMQHATGLYSKIKAVSDNPEDIAKWIAERKKRYPTRENIERQKKEHEERIKRGERLEEDKNRFNRDFSVRRGRLTGTRGAPRGRGKPPQGRGKRLASSANSVGCNKSAQVKPMARKTRRRAPATSAFLSDDEENENCRGKLPAFLGTVAFSHENEETEEEEEKKFSDDEWDLNQERKATANDVAESTASVSKALSNIMGMYASGSSDSEEEAGMSGKQPAIVQNIIEDAGNLQTHAGQSQSNPCSSKDGQNVADPVSSIADDDDSSGPEEVPIKKNLDIIQPVGEPKENKLKAQAPSQSTGRKRKRVHRHRANKRKLESKAQENELSTSKIQKPSQDPTRNNLPLRRRRRTLLEKLLSSEIRHERNLILQCVRFVVNENFFDGADNEQKSEENSVNSGEMTTDNQKIMDKILNNIRVLRHCNRYVVQNNFFGVPCAEGSNCDEDEDD